MTSTQTVNFEYDNEEYEWKLVIDDEVKFSSTFYQDVVDFWGSLE